MLALTGGVFGADLVAVDALHAEAFVGFVGAELGGWFSWGAQEGRCKCKLDLPQRKRYVHLLEVVLGCWSLVSSVVSVLALVSAPMGVAQV